MAFCVIITADCLIYVLCTDMGQFDATKGKQALEIRSSLSERRALTDPILPGDSADLAHAHSRQWAKAHGEFSTRDLKRFFNMLSLLGKTLFAYGSSELEAQSDSQPVRFLTLNAAFSFVPVLFVAF